MYINPDYYLYEKIKELQTKVIRINDELADARHINKKQDQLIQKQKETIQLLKEYKKCQN